MKKLLFLSAVVSLCFAGMAQAQEMQQLRQGQYAEDAAQLQTRSQLMDGSGEMIQARIQEKVQTMQERKSQLREALKKKTKLQEKKQLMQEYKGNEVSEFVKGINNRVQAQTNRIENLPNKLNAFTERVNQKLDNLSDEAQANVASRMNQFLLAHENMQSRLSELSVLRENLAELKASEDWQELKVQILDYKSLLQELRDELKAAISEAESLEEVVE